MDKLHYHHLTKIKYDANYCIAKFLHIKNHQIYFFTSYLLTFGKLTRPINNQCVCPALTSHKTIIKIEIKVGTNNNICKF